jgi:hypothetical protein
MRSLFVCLLAIIVAGIVVPGTVQSADRWNAAQKEVWKTIDDCWATAQAKDKEKMLTFSHPDGFEWPYDEAIPIDADNVRKGITYSYDRNWRIEYYLIQPMEIAVTGTTAVCAYQFSVWITTEGSEKRKEESGRFIETWVKEGGKWLLFASHGGEIEKDDDDK